MEIGLRFLAFIIDIALCFALLPLFVMSSSWVFDWLPGIFALLLIPLTFVFFFTWPFFYFGVPTGLWGRTPGRLICRLKVVTDRDETPGLWRGLGRESLKLLAVGSGIGAMLCIFQILYQGTTWYDQLCGTHVKFTPWIRLTKTQQNFRKHYKPDRFIGSRRRRGQ